MCSRLSREVINAHHQFISRYSGARAIGYFTTSSIVECIYHLAPVMHHSKDNEEQAASVAAFKQAHGILVRISAYNNVAKKALKALNGYVEKWGSHQDARSNGDGRPNGVTDNDVRHLPPRPWGCVHGTHIATAFLITNWHRLCIQILAEAADHSWPTASASTLARGWILQRAPFRATATSTSTSATFP